MRDKLFLFRRVIVAVMICLLIWDGLFAVTQHLQVLPHRDLLLTGALIWVATLFLPQNSDDDNWVGGY